MKEQLPNVIRSVAKNLKVNGLTTRTLHSTLGVEGDIFRMDAGRPTEGPPRLSAPTIETKGSFSIFPQLPTEELLQETGVDRIQNPDQLIAFVNNFQQEARQDPSKNPFKDWSIDRLKKQYLAWHVNTSKIENQQKTFGEKEAIGGYAHPYSASLIEELERRKIDTREVFLEVTKRAAEAGVPVRSMGVAQPPPPPEAPPTERRRPEDISQEEARRRLDAAARGEGAQDLGLSRMINDINDLSRITDPEKRDLGLRGVLDRVNRLFETRGQLNTPELIRQANQIDNYTKELLRKTDEEIARLRLAAEAVPPRGMSDDYRFYQEIRRIDEAIAAIDVDQNLSPEAKTDGKERLMREAQPGIKEHIRTLNPAGVPLETELVRTIIRYEHDDAFEYLVNRIISHPVEAETKRYQSTFYGGINFSLITEAIKGRVEELRRRPEAEETAEAKSIRENRASWLEGLRTKFHLMESGAEFMHNLNRAVVMGSEREFVTLAPEMIPDHFQVLQRAKLASNVMRIFDEEIQRVMARDRLITMKNYAEVTGTIFNKGGNFVGAKEGTVERLLREINEKLPEEEKLDEWELKWAFHAGRNLMNITIRTAELIAHSSGTELGYKSFPQESIARIIDPIDLTGERFQISEQRGGLELTRMARENFHDEKEHHGWGKSNIEKILGKDRKKFEETGILNITGVFSGWRQENFLFIDIPDNGRLEHISIDQFLKSDRYNPNITTSEGKILPGISPGALKGKLPGELKGKRLIEVDPEALKGLFLQPNGELKPHFEHSLGVLLRLGQVLPNENNNNPMLEAKKVVRTAMWRNIAKENPLAMASILYGMQLEGNNALNPRLNGLSNRMYAPANVVTGEKEDTDLWGGLRQKLTIVHEEKMRKMAKETEGAKTRRLTAGEHLTLESVMNDLIAREKTEEGKGTGIVELSAEESVMLSEIQNLGDSLSGELAEVRFPSNPTMNDVLFETTNYSAAGTEFFKRRVGGDLVSFYEAGGKFIELMVDPAGADTEQALGALQAMVKALASPNGLESGQNDIAPVNEAYLDFIREGGQTPKGKLEEFTSFFLKEGMVVNGIRHLRRKGTSLAQTYGSILAPSHNMNEMADILDRELKAEILRRGRPERSSLGQGFRKALTTLRLAKQEEEETWAWTDLYERFRKKFKVKAGWGFGAILRDYILVFGSGALVNFSQKTATEKV